MNFPFKIKDSNFSFFFRVRQINVLQNNNKTKKMELLAILQTNHK
jgi:hypothetical protein